MITLKSDHEIELMREAGRIVALTHKILAQAVVPGITTAELDFIAEKNIRAHGGEPAFKGYNGFPASICTSINEQVVHGIPSIRKLKSGEIISIDVGVCYKGYYGDAAVTLPVGEINDSAAELLEVTRGSLYNALQFARIGNRLSDISHGVQTFAEDRGYHVVRNYVGHGIGTSMHEEPEIPNFGRPGRGPKLQKGMVLAIEPMINIGTWEVETLEDNWTVVTKDTSLSAHFEHTVAIGEEGIEILTELNGG
ncbi:type I methionyl aminopeptidase [Candidatus Contubernalis alkaliaceticus]|uniref:type I methionyl aminopeptidase n=1 Tax=Candidatus Contubernalis alkaliaceticus TaxID=338645 RepID=UPI001F4C425D|nr:type I methionyl aminopeptidase [Candidatus Contubernalis alkalaceticus]UNC90956.1 type I methionyl aminopeptidase [Candidatus Contubernalis alkalaceticus]